VRILVTGGAGYVGSFAARHLARAGHQVVVLDDLSRGHRGAVPADMLVVGAIEDRPLLSRLLADRRIEAVLHFAAASQVGESVADPKLYYRNNVVHTLGLLETMLEHGVRRIVFSSTCAIYGEAQSATLAEDSPERPESPYAFTKLVIERMIRDFARAYGMGFVLLRYFNAAGAAPDGSHGEDHHPESHLIPLVLQTLLGQRPELQVFGDDYPTPDGTCIRDYIHVEDLASAHELAVRACPDGVEPSGGMLFNIGTGTGASVLDVIRAAEQVTGRRVPRRVVARRPGDPPRLVAAASRLREELGWRPRYEDLTTIVEHAWAWHRTHPKGYGD
jgi:UDP-glucose 4-epimerase